MTADGDTRREWDFFVSYAQADRSWAEWIAWVLEEDGHRVLVQAWDMVPGTNWIHEMQAAAKGASRTIAVLSAAYLESIYGSAEWQAAWARDPTGTGRKLLIVRVTDCDRPGLLSGVVSIDLFRTTEPIAKARLRDMVTAALSGRAKPSVAPPFPSTARTKPRFPETLPQVWNVPAHNPNFTGRSTELSDLAKGLASGSTMTVQSVHGMGGVGKTQLAIEYAHAHSNDYDVVWWIAAEEPATIPDQFAALATGLDLEPATDPGALQAQVHEWLRDVQGWLLLFDNADEVEDIRPWLPSRPVTRGTRGHIIVTTRRGGFDAIGHVVDLEVIDLADAVRLLRTRVPDLDQKIGEQIAEELGRLPLALEQTAAYIKRVQMPGNQYLDLLRSRAADMYGRGTPSFHKDTIATLWRISLERMQAENPAAVQLLEICAYLAPDPIPLDLFTSHTDLLPSQLAAAAKDPLAFAEVVAASVDYSLAKRSLTEIQLHRLIQTVIRTRHYAAEPLGVQLPEQVKQPESTPGVALALLHADAPKDIDGSPGSWPRWAVLLPHVLAATGHVDDKEAQQNSAAIKLLIGLLGMAGTYMWVHARYTDAKVVEERALAITEAVYGPDHADVALCLNNLALTLKELGQSAEAQPLQERALAIDEATYGPNHPTMATCLNNLADVLEDLGRPAEAQPLQERALAIDEATYGPNHPTVAIRLNNLGQILRDLGQPAEAQPLQERALAIYETTYGPDHPRVASALNNLAMLLRDLGQLADAQPLMERALAIDEAAYGPDHPRVALRRDNLAKLLRTLKQAGPT